MNTVSQVALRINGADPVSIFSSVRHDILVWLNRKAGRPLPSEAWEGKGFELFREIGYQPVSAAAADNPCLWACRLDDADKFVPQRSWTTEVGLGIAPNGEVLFGCRLLCVTLGEYQPFIASIPGFVKQIAGRYEAIFDGMKAGSTAWIVDEAETADRLIKHILDQKRKHPVVVVSRGTREDPSAPPLVNPDHLAVRMIGAAHIAVAGPRATDRITEILGKEFSVFNRGVRTYSTRLNVETDSGIRHPVASPAKIQSWDGYGPDAFEDFIVSQTIQRSAALEFTTEIPSFARIYEFALEQKRKDARSQGASDAELLTLALNEIDSLKKKNEDETSTYTGLIQAAELERDQAKEELEQREAEVSGLRARIEHLLNAIECKGANEEVPIPDSFDELEEWCRLYVSGNLVVLPRAFRAAKKSLFEEPSLAYRALLLLRNEYVVMRTIGGPATVKLWRDGLAELGLEERPSFAGDRAGEEGDEYKVLWRGRNRLLDMHLKGNSSREERYCFRLYYFWDDETNQVIVGSFPSHLRTRIS